MIHVPRLVAKPFYRRRRHIIFGLLFQFYFYNVIVIYLICNFEYINSNFYVLVSMIIITPIFDLTGLNRLIGDILSLN